MMSVPPPPILFLSGGKLPRMKPFVLRGARNCARVQIYVGLQKVITITQHLSLIAAVLVADAINGKAPL